MGSFVAGLSIAFVALATLIVGLLLLGASSGDQGRKDSYFANCTEAGGHIYAPDYIAFCVSPDGRWVEVYP